MLSGTSTKPCAKVCATWCACSATSSERGRGASALFAHSWRSNWRSNDPAMEDRLRGNDTRLRQWYNELTPIPALAQFRHQRIGDVP